MTRQCFAFTWKRRETDNGRRAYVVRAASSRGAVTVECALAAVHGIMSVRQLRRGEDVRRTRGSVHRECAKRAKHRKHRKHRTREEHARTNDPCTRIPASGLGALVQSTGRSAANDRQMSEAVALLSAPGAQPALTFRMLSARWNVSCLDAQTALSEMVRRESEALVPFYVVVMSDAQNAVTKCKLVQGTHPETTQCVLELKSQGWTLDNVSIFGVSAAARTPSNVRELADLLSFDDLFAPPGGASSNRETANRIRPVPVPGAASAPIISKASSAPLKPSASSKTASSEPKKKNKEPVAVGAASPAGPQADSENAIQVGKRAVQKSAQMIRAEKTDVERLAQNATKIETAERNIAGEEQPARISLAESPKENLKPRKEEQPSVKKATVGTEPTESLLATAVAPKKKRVKLVSCDDSDSDNDFQEAHRAPAVENLGREVDNTPPVDEPPAAVLQREKRKTMGAPFAKSAAAPKKGKSDILYLTFAEREHLFARNIVEADLDEDIALFSKKPVEHVYTNKKGYIVSDPEAWQVLNSRGEVVRVVDKNLNPFDEQKVKRANTASDKSAGAKPKEANAAGSESKRKGDGSGKASAASAPAKGSKKDTGKPQQSITSFFKKK
ncbi:hypothetical protein FVE85_0084 [Porphyridium purpureum]|uniref:DNA polymerase delta subunit 3 n=1 Tax=Porphyridium purpureum TaxID=35688 RepID=A0A5J4YZ03_PORPP|nr:hypothetical protein FVE85_0084 [Porphyridium purpureum]|eukprot:POR4166..scf208_2